MTTKPLVSILLLLGVVFGVSAQAAAQPDWPEQAKAMKEAAKAAADLAKESKEPLKAAADAVKAAKEPLKTAADAMKFATDKQLKVAADLERAGESLKAATWAMKLAGPSGLSPSLDDRADDLYERARDLIEQGKYDRAVSELDRLIPLKSNRTDAAMYWKAYSFAKLGQRAEALTTIADLTKQ